MQFPIKQNAKRIPCDKYWENKDLKIANQLGFAMDRDGRCYEISDDEAEYVEIEITDEMKKFYIL